MKRHTKDRKSNITREKNKNKSVESSVKKNHYFAHKRLTVIQKKNHMRKIIAIT